jgi:hypothetical protein
MASVSSREKKEIEEHDVEVQHVDFSNNVQAK